MASNNSNSIPPTGEESSFPLDDQTHLTVRHGSSLSLMSNVCAFLAADHEEDTFNYIDPTADHHKWARRGLSLYYACVMENNVTGNGAPEIACALRAATGEIGDDEKRKIFLIDYVYTLPSHRDKGIAGKLIASVLEMAKSIGNGGTLLGVLSIEESCVYWLEKWGFLLCANASLNERLNVFPDTHLLIHKDCNVSNDSSIGTSISNGQGKDTAMTQSTTIPPESFISALKELQIVGAGQPALPECLKTLATLIRNAKNDNTEAGKRRTIRINNPVVHSRVFAIGGEAAMKLLQVCGFELQANDEGDAVLKFAEWGYGWLDGAIAQLEFEGNK